MDHIYIHDIGKKKLKTIKYKSEKQFGNLSTLHKAPNKDERWESNAFTSLNIPSATYFILFYFLFKIANMNITTWDKW